MISTVPMIALDMQQVTNGQTDTVLILKTIAPMAILNRFTKAVLRILKIHFEGLKKTIKVIL